jgi:hypothetical protein
MQYNKSLKTAVIRVMIEPDEKEKAQKKLAENRETLSKFLQNKIYEYNKKK